MIPASITRCALLQVVISHAGRTQARDLCNLGPVAIVGQSGNQVVVENALVTVYEVAAPAASNEALAVVAETRRTRYLGSHRLIREYTTSASVS